MVIAADPLGRNLGFLDRTSLEHSHKAFENNALCLTRIWYSACFFICFSILKEHVCEFCSEILIWGEEEIKW
jgi:hypothetical protein